MLRTFARGDVATDHRAHEIARCQLAQQLREHASTVTEHRDALADREDLLESVRDEENRGTVVAQALNDAEKAGHLGR